MVFEKSADPFTVLGVARDAGEAEIRARYLELVKQFPPERDADRFREIRAAYEAAKDVLSIASRLIEPPGDEVPQWAAVIETQKRNPPRLTPAFLLSLGNRAAADANSSGSVIDVPNNLASVTPGTIPQASQGDSDSTPAPMRSTPHE